MALSLQQLQAQARDLPRASGALEPAIEALKAQQRQLEREIKSLSASSPFCTPAATAAPAATASLSCIQELQKVPGIGPITAATIASRLVERVFPHSDSFVAYCGLDIAVKQSGQKRGSRGLTKQGDAVTRTDQHLSGI